MFHELRWTKGAAQVVAELNILLGVAPSKSVLLFRSTAISAPGIMDVILLKAF